MKNIISQNIKVENLTILIKPIIFGLLSVETWYISKIISSKLSEYIISNNYQHEGLIFTILGLLLVGIYLYTRDFISSIWKVLKSGRLDIFIAFCAGILISISFGGIGISVYTKIISSLAIRQLFILTALPLIVGLSILIRRIQVYFIENQKKESSYFINDIEQKSKKDDLLGFSDEAERFAERILNQGSSDSMVFGIDASWGIGKSTFVNFCKEYWENNYGNEVIVYNFNPLRYEDRSNLLDKFVDGLIRAIQKKAFVPEIRPLISNYSRFIKRAKSSFSVFGFEILMGSYTVDDAFEELEIVLSGFKNKIIIVVDDLDRLSFTALKDVLFTIKKSFTLSNISYVLCYDTENINALEKEKPDIEKVTEFLEKFVNVKVSLYLDSLILSNYVSKNLEKVLDGNSQANPRLVSKAIGGLIEIYKSNDYYRYLPFIGDVRKLKRLINTLLLLEIEKTDFDNSDINSQDLIHLLLIYINYPSIFRKIYNTETQGKRGYFSVVIPYDDDYPKDGKNQTDRSDNKNTYKNSREYEKYIGLLTENQKFLLNKVFDPKQRLENTVIDNVSQEIKHSYACFNGSWNDGKNLEEYLNLIVKLSKPQKHIQYRFYLNCKNEIANGKLIENVLSKDEFSNLKSEDTHEQFWRVVTNSSYEFDSKTGANIINYLLDNIKNYSMFTCKDIGIGLRDDLGFFLIKLLDVAAWTDGNGKHSSNNEENISEIAEWIFGEGRHYGKSVVDILGKEERGILGLYDLIAFRLHCCADRGGDIFNLTRALSKHADPDAPTVGLVNNIVKEEMREISQKTFKIFEDQYINKDKNIFKIIDELSINDVTGKYQSYVQGKINSGAIRDADQIIAVLKSRMTTFITYQIGNSFINLGVGCGYYDQTGKEDKKGISIKFNDYLFTKCFDISTGQNNYEYFVDYLLMNLARTSSYSESGDKYIPHINEFTKVLDRDRLAQYWKLNSTSIRALNLDTKEKTVFTSNYIASYKSELIKTYKVLDELVQQT